MEYYCGCHSSGTMFVEIAHWPQNSRIGRAWRDSATHVVQGWHSQHDCFADVSEPIITKVKGNLIAWGG
ncbi:unnamed protein product [Rhodiola kirilowii]